MSDPEVVLDEANQLPPLESTATELERMLECIEKEILPITRANVAKGHKWFGAAVLNGQTLETFLAESNTELDCPLFHGEVHTIYEWSKKVPSSERGPAAKASVFLSTHEPCCMCVSSIVWAGFRKIYYLFPYSLTSAQGIPHDINIMHELWGVRSYRKQSKFCSTACILDLVEALDDTEEKKESLRVKCNELIDVYDKIAKGYHAAKTEDIHNTLAFG